MVNTEYPGNWLRILIEKLEMPSTAEFCRKAGLSRGLVDKLMADAHRPRMDTLEKIKKAFPQTNMNWLVSGIGNVLEEVLDDEEAVILDLYRKNIKGRNDTRLTMSFVSAVAWVAQEHDEWEQMDINAKAVELEEGEIADFRASLLLKQRQRRLVSEVLRRTSKTPRGLLDMQTRYEELKELLGQVNDSIQGIINLLVHKE
jgi:transcriptional regulator with XRE-family HTH domain